MGTRGFTGTDLPFTRQRHAVVTTIQDCVIEGVCCPRPFSFVAQRDSELSSPLSGKCSNRPNTIPNSLNSPGCLWISCSARLKVNDACEGLKVVLQPVVKV